jgi:hypothetical protein
MYVGICPYGELKPLEREKHKAQKVEWPCTDVLLGSRRNPTNIYQNSNR